MKFWPVQVLLLSNVPQALLFTVLFTFLMGNANEQVWASGFSAALLKRRSSVTKPALSHGEVEEGVSVEAASQGALANLELGGANGFETAVHSVLEKFFSFFLKLPAIKQ